MKTKPITTISIDGEKYKIEGYDISGDTVKMYSGDTIIVARCVDRVGVPVGKMTQFETLDRHGIPDKPWDDERKDENGSVFHLRSVRPKTRAEGGCRVRPITSISLWGKKYNVESYDFTSYSPPIMRLYTDSVAIDVESVANNVIRIPRGKLIGQANDMPGDPADESFCSDEHENLYQVHNIRLQTKSEKSGKPCPPPPPPKKTKQELADKQIEELHAIIKAMKAKRAAVGRKAGKMGGRPKRDNPEAIDAAIQYALEKCKQGYGVSRACAMACGHFAADATVRQPYTITIKPGALSKHVTPRWNKVKKRYSKNLT